MVVRYHQMEPKQIFRELKLPLPQNLPQAVKNLLKGCLQKDGKTRPAFTGIQESFEEKVQFLKLLFCFSSHIESASHLLLKRQLQLV